MKKFLIAGIAAIAIAGTPVLAADMPVKAPPTAAAPMFNWTGCYLGANVGGGWGRDSDWVFVSGLGVGGRPHYSGGVGGGQVGCDYQSGPWVFGIAGMFDESSLSGHSPDPLAAGFTAHTELKWLATATGRVGYAIDRSLVYVEGGAAWSDTKRFFIGPGTNPVDTTEKTGWVAGIGWEYMFAPNWSWKVQYSHAGFGTGLPNVISGGGGDPMRVKQNFDLVLVGLNFRFGTWGKAPVVAKY